jgi:hypothetical protein
VAISWFNNAFEFSKPGQRITNIAQLFSGSALNIICRISSGVYVPKDVQGKRIGVWGVGDQDILYELLDQLSIPRNSVEVVIQRANGEDLIDGNVACGKFYIQVFQARIWWWWILKNTALQILKTGYM